MSDPVSVTAPDTAGASESVPSSSERTTVGEALRSEVLNFHPRLRWMYFCDRFLPRRTGSARRAALLRSAGFSIGPGTAVQSMPRITGSARGAHIAASRGLFRNLTVGRDCTVEPGVVLDLEEHITIGDNVVIGPQVMILTSTHELGPREHRRAQ